MAEESFQWAEHAFDLAKTQFIKAMDVKQESKPMPFDHPQYKYLKKIRTYEAMIAQGIIEAALASYLLEADALIDKIGDLTRAVNEASANIVWPDVTINRDNNKPSNDNRKKRSSARIQIVSEYPNADMIKKIIMWRNQRVHENHFKAYIDEPPVRIRFWTGPFPNKGKSIEMTYGEVCEAGFYLVDFTCWWQSRLRAEIEGFPHFYPANPGAMSF